MEETKICAPWITYWHKMQAMFGDDPDIRMEYDDKTRTIRMRVEGEEKAEALAKLLPEEKAFGPVLVRTTIIPANKQKGVGDLIFDALNGNPNFSYLWIDDSLASNPYCYAVFAKKVCQYWNDNLGDPHGNVSCLYQDLAKELFGEVAGVLYCTDNREPEE